MENATLAAYLIGFLFVAQSLHVLNIWICGKLLNISGATFPKSLLIVLVNLLINVVMALPTMLWAGRTLWPHASPELGLALYLGEFIFTVTLMWYLVRRCFQTTGRRAALLICVTTITGLVIGVSVAIGARIYIADAFVIPTGSMAPTIIGVHGEATCPNCGSVYSVSMSDRFDPEGRFFINSESKTACCPNCNAERVFDAKAPIYSGDRILADKRRAPHRWDPIVYVPPIAPSQNYLHRLVGLPGEKLDIVDGDVFVNERRLVKPSDEQEDLWFPVHYSAFQPKNLQADAPRWNTKLPDSGWQFDQGKWKCINHQRLPAELVFSGQITSEQAFNVPTRFSPVIDPNNVGDVRLDCTLPSWPTSGTWGWRWRFAGAEVVAQFDGGRQCSLSASTIDGKREADTKAITSDDVAATTPIVVTFCVRDGQAAVLIGGQAIETLEILPPELSKRQAVPRDSHCELSLFAAECELEFDRIVLRRDVYYVQPMNDPRRRFDDHFSIALAADEMFVLGDNSDHAADSRYHGPFKTNQFIGVARWIYWPPSRWHAFR